MLKTTLFALVLVLLAFPQAYGEMYQWVDENGVVTFKDTPPPPSGKRRKVKIYNDSDFDLAPPTRESPAKSGDGRKAMQPQSGRKVRFTGTVEIYVTEWCGYCRKAQSYLQSKGVPYIAYDIENDSSAKKRHRELGGRGVPLIIVGSKKMNGFSRELLEQFLNSSD
jgi:glutaredoxin-like YruB-family protein